MEIQRLVQSEWLKPREKTEIPLSLVLFHCYNCHTTLYDCELSKDKN